MVTSAVIVEATDGEFGQSLAERGDDEPFLGVTLSAVVGQFDDVEPVGHRSEQSAGLNRRKLLGVTDQDHFRLGSLGVLHERRHQLGAKHPGLVDHHHVAGVESPSPGSRVRCGASAW